MKYLRLLTFSIFLLTLYLCYVKQSYPFDWPNFLWGVCVGMWTSQGISELAEWAVRRKNR